MKNCISKLQLNDIVNHTGIVVGLEYYKLPTKKKFIGTIVLDNCNNEYGIYAFNQILNIINERNPLYFKYISSVEADKIYEWRRPYEITIITKKEDQMNSQKEINEIKNKIIFPMAKLTMTELTTHQKEYLDGLMLGDGCLHISKSNGSINASLSVVRSARDEQYLEDNFNIFKEFCSRNILKYLRNRRNYFKGSDPIKFKTFEYVRFKTRLHYLFTEQYKRWYPNRVKTIPRDLILTPLIIAIWLCDDGSVIQCKTGYRLRIVFYSMGFVKEDNEFLCELLNKRYNTDEFYIKESPNRGKYNIHANDTGARLLLKDIIMFFLTSMERKSNKWREEKIRFYTNEPPPVKKSNAPKKYYTEENYNKIIDLFKINKILCKTEIAEKMNWFKLYKNKTIPNISRTECHIKRLLQEGLIKKIENPYNKYIKYEWI